MGAGLGLEVKLGLRLLAKHPGISVVSGVTVALAIAIGSAAADFVHDITSADLPLEDGHRVVGIVNWNVEQGAPSLRSLHDFEVWRTQARSLQDVGAFARTRLNLIMTDGRAEPIDVTRITPSAFRLTRVRAFLGRTLIDADERDDAPPVVVLAFGPWQSLFSSDSGIVGKTISLGGSPTTVVGVMPREFAFPVDDKYWVPLREKALNYARLEGPSIRVFGRLRDGFSRDAAQTELTVLGQRAASAAPPTDEHIRPRVLPYVEAFSTDLNTKLATIGVATTFAALLLIAGLNVATLTFARAVAREDEIVTRLALGASRGRIISQFFVEALVLVSIAATVGVVVAWKGLLWVLNLATDNGNNAPFWWDFGLAPRTILYAVVAAVACAALMGVVPAAKLTWRIRKNLQPTSAQRGGSRFGALWTTIIVGQVALSVAVLPYALSRVADLPTVAGGGTPFSTSDYVTVRFERNRPDGETEAVRSVADTAFARFQQEMVRRLEAMPNVRAVTFTSAPPGTSHPATSIEAETEATPNVAGPAARVRLANVSHDFFERFGAPMLSGRGFLPAERSTSPVAIVNRSFATTLFGARNAVGRRIREVQASGKPGEWREIVGVVDDLGMNPTDPGDQAGIYFPASDGALTPVHMIVRLRGDAASVISQIRVLSLAVDPTVRVYDLMPLDRAGRQDRLGYMAFAGSLAFVAFCALLLAGTGVHAMTALIVARRTREIGIRVALGGTPRSILSSVFQRTMAQIGGGVVLGSVVASFGLMDEVRRQGIVLFLFCPLLFLIVGVVACAAPARRALRIEPIEALRSDG
jgi:putative ABC transport system permease protein